VQTAECDSDAAASFAKCLKDNACAPHGDAEDKCDCYASLATCYRDSLGVCVTVESYREFQRSCVRNAGCELFLCRPAATEAPAAAASTLSASAVALLVAVAGLTVWN
jgi:hypothetical protein